MALTASARSEDAARCFHAGMDDYLAKPFTIETLAELVSRWCEARAEGQI